MDELTAEKISQDFAAAFAAFGVTMQEFGVAIERARPAIEESWRACEASYAQAGRPYGSGDDGMIRWLREQAGRDTRPVWLQAIWPWG